MKLLTDYCFQDYELYNVKQYLIHAYKYELDNKDGREYYIIYGNKNHITGSFISKAGFDQIKFLKTQKLQHDTLAYCIKTIFEKGDESINFRFIKQIYEYTN